MNVKWIGGWLVASLLLVAAGAGDARAQLTDLAVTVVGPLFPPTPGDDVVYTVTISNNGVTNATDVEASDFLWYPGLTFDSNTGDCVAAYPCSFGTILPGGTRTITTTYNLSPSYSPPNALQITFYVEYTHIDTDTSNDFKKEITQVTGDNCGNYAVALGETFTCAIVAGNDKIPPDTVEHDRIECWGDNSFDQVAPVPTGAFEAITSGGNHSCGLRDTGAIECWGDDFWGQLTDTPAGTGYIQVDAGFDHTCAIRADNSVECWGANYEGQIDAPAGVFVQVAGGNLFSCGIRSDGKIQCWGETGGPYGIISGTPTDDDFVQVVAGYTHACGRHDDGTVDCWGTGFAGEELDPPGTFLTIAAGQSHNCGLRADSTVFCWGGNSDGEGTPPADAFTALDAGGYHTCGILSDGAIDCWGQDFSRESVPPFRSDLCPTCGDGLQEGKETCEPCLAGEPDDQGEGPRCNVVVDEEFDICCSPVTCTPFRLTQAQVCRPGVGSCDPAELCDGVNFDSCPADDPFKDAGTVCRLALGVCDPQETCDGTSNQCPADDPFKDSTDPCRIAAGSCDVPENCTGSTVNCPADDVIAASTPCRPSGGICDIEEQCDGTAAACPADDREDGSFECRGSDGICDVEEYCDGGVDCPENDFLSAANTCRGALDVCDFAEVCTGTSAACPDDILQPDTLTCRPASLVCDLAEKCTGNDVSCPPDDIKSAAQVCRGAADICDAAENCDGVGKECPGDLNFQPASFTCRAAASDCDVAEQCTGAAIDCPADAFASTVTSCNDGTHCNGADNCNGSGGCTVHAGDPCPGPDGDFNCLESCDEDTDSCTASDTDGSACSDGLQCTEGDACQTGVCIPGDEPPCDDDDLCTEDSCSELGGCDHIGVVQESGCQQAGRFSFSVKDTGDPTKNQMKFGWKKGEPVPPAGLGSPTTETDYALCLFDYRSGVPELVASYTVPPEPVLWREFPGVQVSYKDKYATVNGVTQLKVRTDSRPEKSGATFRAKASNFEVPAPFSGGEYFDMDPSLTIQLRSEAGMCLTADFLPEHAKYNRASYFQGAGEQ